MKILAIQFRYFGDAALVTPAMRAIKERFPDSELHALVPAEVAPVFQHLPWLTRVWAMPRTRGRVRTSQTWPLIRALRRECFDRSVEFVGNDRGAILSLLCGARERLGPFERGGFVGRRFCYHQRVPQAAFDRHESLRYLHILSGWGITETKSLEMEIRADPALATTAESLLPGHPVLCHLATSQPKKEWPTSHWAELQRRAAASGIRLVFSTGPSPREQSLLEQLKKLSPDVASLPTSPDLNRYLAVLQRARVFICGDTGPLHFAAGLGVPTIALLGPTPASRWAPIGARHQVAGANSCTCGGNTAVCERANPCMAEVSAAEVFRCLQRALGKPH